jgi:hypothetical protein
MGVAGECHRMVMATNRHHAPETPEAAFRVKVPRISPVVS